jgi:hypothetical protein
VTATAGEHRVPRGVERYGVEPGKWRLERTARKATLVLEPFEPVPAAVRRALQDEAEALVRFVEPGAPAHAVRAAGR